MERMKMSSIHLENFSKIVEENLTKAREDVADLLQILQAQKDSLTTLSSNMLFVAIWDTDEFRKAEAQLDKCIAALQECVRLMKDDSV